MKLKFAFIFALACSAPQQDTPDMQLPPDPILFTYTGDRTGVVDAALSRWSAATCIDMVRVSDGSDLKIVFTPKAEMPNNLTGHTGGRWDSYTIQVKAEFRDEWAEAVLVHELFHGLAATNGHTSKGVAAQSMDRTSLIDSEAVTLVCIKQDCQCFTPEF